MIPVQHIAASQMFFLIEGMNDAARREGQPPIYNGLYKRIEKETQGGVVEFVEGLSPIIDTLTACVLVALESDGMDFPGVFEYEVTSTVGDLLYSNNYAQLPLNQDYKQLRLRITERAHDFFMQGATNHGDYTRYLLAVGAIERALADGTYTFRGASR